MAAHAVTAMEDLAARLRATVNTHNDALAIAHEDFEGETRSQFDLDFTGAMDSLLTFARTLDGEANGLRSTIAYAHYLESLMQPTPP
jgi:hypothetical protein